MVASLGGMPALVAAEIWHFWIGVVLLGVSILAVIGLVAWYLKSVTATKYPSRRQRSDV